MIRSPLDAASLPVKGDESRFSASKGFRDRTDCASVMSLSFLALSRHNVSSLLFKSCNSKLLGRVIVHAFQNGFDGRHRDELCFNMEELLVKTLKFRRWDRAQLEGKKQ